MYNLTKEQAECIRELRKSHSWRALADVVNQKYPELDIEVESPQLAGKQLCRDAEKVLGLKPWEID